MLARFSCASFRAAAFSAHAALALASAAFAANTIPPIRRKKTRNETSKRTAASITPETIRVGGYFNRVLKLPAQERIAQPPHQAGIFRTARCLRGPPGAFLRRCKAVSKAARRVNG